MRTFFKKKRKFKHFSIKEKLILRVVLFSTAVVLNENWSTRKHLVRELQSVAEPINLMGGALDCQSQAGKGSIFFFSIEQEKSCQTNVEPTIRRAKGLEGRRVLIVDDNATNRDILLHQTAFWKMHGKNASSGTNSRAMKSR